MQKTAAIRWSRVAYAAGCAHHYTWFPIAVSAGAIELLYAYGALEMVPTLILNFNFNLILMILDLNTL